MEKKFLRIIGIVVALGFILTLVAGYFGFKSYQKFPLKARQRYNVGVLHDLHKAYQKQFEKIGHYCTDLSKLRDVVDFMTGHMNTEVKFGFTKASESCEGVGLSPANKDSDILANRSYINYPESSERLPKESFQEVAERFCPECTATAKAYKIIAFSNLDSDETLDVWVMDQDKKILNISNDVEN